VFIHRSSPWRPYQGPLAKASPFDATNASCAPIVRPYFATAAVEFSSCRQPRPEKHVGSGGWTVTDARAPDSVVTPDRSVSDLISRLIPLHLPLRVEA